MLDALVDQFIADIIGAVSVTLIAVFFLYYLCQEVQQVRKHRRQETMMDSDSKYFNLRRCIRSLCLIWALFEIPFYGANIWNDIHDDMDNSLDAWAYAGHLVSQAAIYGAFCGFTVLWLVILKFTQRAITCVAAVTVCFSLAYSIFTIFLCVEIIASNGPDISLPLYQYDFIVIPVTLMSVSFLFLGYGAYLQIVLHSWYKNNIGWQRHVLIKLNTIVCTITLACVLRTTMVVLLRIELDTHAWEFFTASDNGNTHPILWILTAQIIPFCTLAIVLFYMSRPSTHSEKTTAISSSSQSIEALVQGQDQMFVAHTTPDETMDYYVAQSPSYSHSYFLTNQDGPDDSADEQSFRGGRSIKENRGMEVEARTHSLPNSLDMRPTIAVSTFGSFRSKKSSDFEKLIDPAHPSGNN